MMKMNIMSIENQTIGLLKVKIFLPRPARWRVNQLQFFWIINKMNKISLEVKKNIMNKGWILNWQNVFKDLKKRKRQMTLAIE